MRPKDDFISVPIEKERLNHLRELSKKHKISQAEIMRMGLTLITKHLESREPVEV